MFCWNWVVIFFQPVVFLCDFLFLLLNFQYEKKVLLRCTRCFATNQKDQNRLGFEAKKLCDQSCSVSVALSDLKTWRRNIIFNRLQVPMRGKRSGTLDCSDCSSKVHKGQQHEWKSKSYLSILTAACSFTTLESSAQHFHNSFPKQVFSCKPTVCFSSWVTKIESKHGFGLATCIPVETLLQLCGFSEAVCNVFPPDFHRNEGKDPKV